MKRSRIQVLLCCLLVTFLYLVFFSFWGGKEKNYRQHTTSIHGREAADVLLESTNTSSAFQSKEPENPSPKTKKGVSIKHLNSYSYWQRLFQQEIPHGYVTRVIRDIERQAIPMNSNKEPLQVDYSNPLSRNTKEISNELYRQAKLGTFGPMPTRNDTICTISMGYCFVFPRPASSNEPLMKTGVALRLKDRTVITWDLEGQY